MYIENPDEEQQNQNQSSSAPSVGAGGGGAAVGTGGTTSTGGNPSTIQPVQLNQPSQSFATVQDYLGANKQQGENFGNQFVSDVSGAIPTEKSSIDTSASNAANEVTAATPKYDSSVVSKAFSNPTDQTNIANYLGQANASYNGPSSFESSDQYTPAITAANEANQYATELGTTGGREQLLQDKYNVYGQGNKGLDQTLLQNSSAYPNIPPLKQSFQSVNDYLKAASDNVNNNLIPTAQTAATTAQTNTANDVTNAWNTFNNTLQARVNPAINAAYPGLPANSLPTFIQNIGATPQQLQEAVGTPEEYERAQAFANLTNTPNTLLPSEYENVNPVVPNQTILNYIRDAARKNSQNS